MKTRLSIIVPCYNNELHIRTSFSRLLENEASLADEAAFEYVFIDDGSTDATWQELKNCHALHPEKVRLVRLGKNAGSYIAVTAGMKAASGDVNVIIAADLQDPVELMAEMFTHWKNGFQLVIGQRTANRDAFVPRSTSRLFNSLMRKYALPDLPKGGFDFVLFDRKVKDAVLQIGEKNTNVLYLMFSLGYPTALVPYVREARKAGKSSWTFKKKLKLFADSFIAFSFVPVRILSIGGLALGLLTLVYAICTLAVRLNGDSGGDQTSVLMIVVLFMGSLQLIGLGILGEYLWRILDEVRNRPQYTVIEEL